jgi:hypothetical protein
LWRIERYADFLEARRELLVTAANDFLDTLRRGNVPEQPDGIPVLERDIAIPGGIARENEEDLLIEVNQWVVDQGLPEGEFLFELVDSESGEPYGVLDLAWPDGLQEGLSVPVALLIDEPKETEAAANRAGFRYFTSVEAFRSYVEREILAVDEEAA